MALTPLTQVHFDHVVTFNDDLIFTFQLVPIPGATYQGIIDDNRNEDDGKASHETVAADMMYAGIEYAYSSVDSKPDQFTFDDAEMIWNTWPEWARWSVYNAVIAYSTRGPSTDPFGKSDQKGNGD